MKTIIIGSRLAGEDNKSYSNISFFKKGSATVCDECKCVNSPYYLDKNLILMKKLDFSATYEGNYIVSERFKEFCIENLFQNVLFIKIDSVEGYYYILILGKPLEINIDKSEIKIESICKTCGYYKEVIGGIYNLFINQRMKIDEGFYTTNIYWRTHFLFKQNIIVGLMTAEKLKKQKFKGLQFKKVLGV